jgi:hypothetical protein
LVGDVHTATLRIPRFRPHDSTLRRFHSDHRRSDVLPAISAVQ